MVTMHFDALRSSSKLTDSEREDIERICDTTLGDYIVCTKPRDEMRGIHGCVVRKDTFAGDSREGVFACGCSTVIPTFPGIGGPMTIEDITKLRAIWTRLSKDVDLVMGSTKSITETFSRSRQDEVRRSEQRTWSEYCTVMYDMVRTHVVGRFRLQLDASCQPFVTEVERSAEIDRVGGITLLRYVEALALFSLDFRRRVTRDEIGSTRDDATSPMMCFYHRKVGHFLPIHGFQSYDPRCFICPIVTDTYTARIQPSNRIAAIEPPSNTASSVQAASSSSRRQQPIGLGHEAEDEVHGSMSLDRMYDGE